MVKNKMCDYRKMYEACCYLSLVLRYLLAQKGRDSILFPVRPSTFDTGRILCSPEVDLSFEALCPGSRPQSSLHSYGTRGKRMQLTR